MLLYRTALHPEFFGIEGRKRIEHGDYEFEMWIFRGGHCFLFQHAGACVAEIVTDRVEPLPAKSLITVLPCAGERDHEEKLGDRLEVVTSIQTETLTDHLYVSTYNEMVEHGRDGDCLMSLWHERDNQPNLSLLDTQRYKDEIHVQSYHLRSDCALVLRTQTIFRCVAPKAGPGRRDPKKLA
jgi:hypothetical protein